MKVTLQLVVVVLNAQANFCDDLSRLRQTANVRFKLTISENGYSVYKNCPKRFLWIKLK